MISKRNGEYILECDECGEEVDGFDFFDEAVEYAKDEQWTLESVRGGWENLCPDCS